MLWCFDHLQVYSLLTLPNDERRSHEGNFRASTEHCAHDTGADVCEPVGLDFFASYSYISSRSAHVVDLQQVSN